MPAKLEYGAQNAVFKDAARVSSGGVRDALMKKSLGRRKEQAHATVVASWGAVVLSEGV